MMRFLLGAGALFAAYKIADELLMRPMASGSDEPTDAELGAVDEMYKQSAITLDEEGAAEGVGGVSHA